MRGRATEYVVAVEEGADVDQVAAGLRAALGADYEVRTWRELQPALVEAIRARGLTLAGWVANRVDPHMASADDNITTLAARLGAPMWAEVPHFAATDERRDQPRLAA